MSRDVASAAMSKLAKTASWADGLTSTQLHNLAVMTGSACSGTKRARIQGIEGVMASSPLRKQAGLNPSTHSMPTLSVVTIDMGIRNLAYAHLTASAKLRVEKGMNYTVFGSLRLRAWQRLSISASMEENASIAEATGKVENAMKGAMVSPSAADFAEAEGTSNRVVMKESFEPSVYATHAYNLIRTIVTTHQPNHILIERQRFRSGGGSAVQEWTIRVGVFEGMLYAVLKTLAEERGIPMAIQGIPPTRVNRYWLENDLRAASGKKMAGSEVKKAKIDVVGKLLQQRQVAGATFDVAAEAQDTVDEFLTKWNQRAGSTRFKGSSTLTKLDDVSDCLLQGLAWIEWQNSVERLRALGPDAFQLT